VGFNILREASLIEKTFLRLLFPETHSRVNHPFGEGYFSFPRAENCNHGERL